MDTKTVPVPPSEPSTEEGVTEPVVHPPGPLPLLSYHGREVLSYQDREAGSLISYQGREAGSLLSYQGRETGSLLSYQGREAGSLLNYQGREAWPLISYQGREAATAFHTSRTDFRQRILTFKVQKSF